MIIKSKRHGPLRKVSFLMDKIKRIDVAMLMYGKEASSRKQEIDRRHQTIPDQRS